MTELATRAEISAATLSRVERDKQAIDLGLFLSLARILKMAPHELLGDADTDEGIAPIVRAISGMQAGERANLWRTLAAERKTRRASARTTRPSSSAELDELLAQVDFIRGEIEAVQKRIRRH